MDLSILRSAGSHPLWVPSDDCVLSKGNTGKADNKAAEIITCEGIRNEERAPERKRTLYKLN